MVDYNLEGESWAYPNQITWSFATANYAGQAATFSSYLKPGMFEDVVKTAFATWQSVANLTFTQVADSSSVNIRLGYGVIDGPSGVIGQTGFFFDAQSHFLPGVVIRFDQAENYALSAAGPVLYSGGSFLSLALHEIGHALGLDHYNAAPAIMNPVISSTIQALQLSDIDGIQALYGAKGATPAAPSATPSPGPGSPVTMGREWSVSALADYNGDKTADVLWADKAGHLALWTMSGGAPSAVAVSPGSMGPGWKAFSGAGDFDKDGRSDVLWTSGDTGQVAIWEMMGANIGVFGVPAGSMGPEWQVAGVGDFTGDGYSDILWTDANNDVAIWGMNGTTLTSFLPSSGKNGLEWHLSSTGDYNGDGKTDLAWLSDSGDIAVWLMNGGAPSSAVIGHVGPGWRIAASADVDKSGTSDLVLVNDQNKTDVLMMTSGRIASSVTSHATLGTEWHLQGAGDVSGDGVGDLFWTRDDGMSYVWSLRTLGVSPVT